MVNTGASMTQQILDDANRALHEGRLEEAEKLLRGAVKADPKSVTPHVALATVLTRRKQHAAAAESYANAMRLDRNRKGLAVAYAVACYHAGRYDEAEKSARFAVEVEPSLAAYDALACALREQGKSADALAAIEGALRLTPASNSAQNTKGSILLAMGRNAEALTIFEELNDRGVQAVAITLN